MTSEPPRIDAPPPADDAALSDAELVARARRGDADAYGRLVRRHFDRVYGLVYNMLGHRQDAEDVVQTAFVRAYLALGRFRGDAAFSTWIYRIAVNTALSALARRGRQRAEISLSDLGEDAERDPVWLKLAAADTTASPSRRLSIKELQARLNEALQKLSEAHRTVVVLHDIQGLRHEEIAEILGTRVGTVRSRLFYARQQLQAELTEFAP